MFDQHVNSDWGARRQHFKWVASSLLSSIKFNSHQARLLSTKIFWAADNGCFSSQQPACNSIKCLYDWQKCSKSDSRSELWTFKIGVQYGVTHKHSKQWAMSIWSKRGWVVNIPNRSPVRAFKPNSRGLTGPQRPVPSCVPRNAQTCVANIYYLVHAHCNWARHTFCASALSLIL